MSNLSPQEFYDQKFKPALVMLVGAKAENITDAGILLAAAKPVSVHITQALIELGVEGKGMLEPLARFVCKGRMMQLIEEVSGEFSDMDSVTLYGQGCENIPAPSHKSELFLFVSICNMMGNLIDHQSFAYHVSMTHEVYGQMVDELIP